MTIKFDIAVNYVLENEKGLSTDKTDLGGITNFGISEKFLFNLKPKDELPIRTNDERKIAYLPVRVLFDQPSFLKDYILYLSIERAKLIYKNYFWLPIYEEIDRQVICNYIFDMHVQHGPYKAAELVQRSLCASNEQINYIKIDGQFGENTLSEINGYHFRQLCDLESFVRCLISSRESLFRCIAAHDKTQESKLEGWLKRCYKLNY